MSALQAHAHHVSKAGPRGCTIEIAGIGYADWSVSGLRIDHSDFQKKREVGSMGALRKRDHDPRLSDSHNDHVAVANFSRSGGCHDLGDADCRHPPLGTTKTHKPYANGPFPNSHLPYRKWELGNGPLAYG